MGGILLQEPVGVMAVGLGSKRACMHTVAAAHGHIDERAGLLFADLRAVSSLSDVTRLRLKFQCRTYGVLCEDAAALERRNEPFMGVSIHHPLPDRFRFG